MTEEQQDKLLIEMHTDIKWLKQFSVEHKKTHAKYVYYFIGTLVAICLSWFR